MINYAISALVKYSIEKGLIEEIDSSFVVNSILSILNLNTYTYEEVSDNLELEEILASILEYAVSQNIIEDSITQKDLFDTKIMSVLVPRPSDVSKKFWDLYNESPNSATDWYYDLSKNSDYIRTYRIKKDQKWTVSTKYGELDVTINLSKPEKDVKSIAAAKNIKSSNYPKCLLCRENEGYAGNLNHPARQNHRVIPVTINNSHWFMQYSPYVYYNEHCIIFNGEHTPMEINKATFQKLLDFISQFPHYFVGSNADLPIVGGSILSHDHFQGGHYEFAMERAEVIKPVSFKGFDSVEAGIVKWPLSVIRLTSENKQDLIELSNKILTSWRKYTDESAFIFAETYGTPHNTITPIARMKNGKFQLDLVLRNNITTKEHPDGVYHPHAELHHIKKENIGLIEVMGLAVLPPRLKTELEELAEVLVSGGDLEKSEKTKLHAVWAKELCKNYTFTKENVDQILKKEVGKVFEIVLEHSGVYTSTPKGIDDFMKFIDNLNGEKL